MWQKQEAQSLLRAAVIITVTWALFHGVLLYIHGSPVLLGELSGPDSFMRLVRVETFLDGAGLDGAGWYDSTIPRSNAPFGEVLHWTRPFDLLIIGLSLPLVPFLGWKSGLFWAGSLSAPLLGLFTAISVCWAVRPIMKNPLFILPAIAIMVQPVVAAYSSLGRADHHTLFLLIFVLQIGFLLRALGNRYDSESPLWAGLLCGFGLWLSVEFLLQYLVLASALGFAWLFDPRDRLKQNMRFAASTAAMVTLAVLAENPPSQLFTLVFDRISSAHFYLAVLLLVFWLVLEALYRRLDFSTLTSRLLLAAVIALLLLVLLRLTVPGFFESPLGQVDPRIVPLWLNLVTEMGNLIPSDRETLGKLITYMGHGIIALPYLGYRIWREKEMEARLPWAGLGLAALAFGVIAVLHVRFASFAEVIFIFALAGFIDSSFEAAEPIKNLFTRSLVRSLAIAFVFIGPVVAGQSIINGGLENFSKSKEEQAGIKDCRVKSFADYFNSSKDWNAESVIVGFMDYGPQFLYYTDARVIGTPYHRNGNGIVDGYRILASNDDSVSRQIAEARGADLIVLCQSPAERLFYTRGTDDENLYLRLLDERDIPEWIEPMELPPDLKDTFKLYRINL